MSGSVAIASALNGSTLFMYNIESTKLVMSFNLSSLASMVDTPPGVNGEEGYERESEVTSRGGREEGGRLEMERG